jgi:hypothetical protein
VNVSGEYINEVYTFQKKWSKLIQLSETKRKQACPPGSCYRCSSCPIA